MANLCTVPGCCRQQHAKGFCNAHYQHFYSHGDLRLNDPIGKRSNRYGSPCKQPGCDGVASAGAAFGYCAAHYMRFKKGADMTSPIGRIRQKEKRIDKNGYACWNDMGSVYKSNSAGLVLEHRHVMSEFLGRRLLDSENVHHKNGDRSDNRLENLELWVTPQPSGQRVQELVAWALDILMTYGSDAEKLSDAEESAKDTKLRLDEIFFDAEKWLRGEIQIEFKRYLEGE